MEYQSILVVTSRLLHLWGILNYFTSSFLDFYGYEVVSSCDAGKNEVV